jgi:hypothetical protein
MPLSHAASNVIKQLLGEMIPGTETFRRGQPLSVVSEVRRELVAHELLNTTFRSLITQYDPKIWPQKTLETDPPLRHVLAQELPGAPPLPRCPSRETMNASCGASFGDQPLPPTLLLFHFPWLDVHTGHARVWTLLHVLRYRCFFELLNMRMVVMVQPGELPRCQKICKPAGLTDGDEGERTRFCRCHEAKHHREYQQRNIAEFCTGREHILYACDCLW